MEEELERILGEFINKPLNWHATHIDILRTTNDVFLSSRRRTGDAKFAFNNTAEENFIAVGGMLST